MELEKMMIEGQLIWKNWIDEIKKTPWYVYFAKMIHIVFFVVGTLIAIKIASYTLGLIVLLVTVAYVLFWAFFLRKRIEPEI